MTSVVTALIAGALALAAGLGVLVAGLVPPGLLATGQIDAVRWLLPLGVGAVVLIPLVGRLAGRLSAPLAASALLVLAVPPLALWLQGSHPGIGRSAMTSQTFDAPRPAVGLLSGPPLYGPESPGGFDGSPLWRVLSQRADMRPLDAIESDGIESLDAMLVVQPRALAPDELVALDQWVRMGGHAVLLADPELLWDDGRAMGHALKPPRHSLLGPLLTRWGVELEPAAVRVPGTDPVERRFLTDGALLQLAGASRFSATGTGCAVAEQGLVARCAVGKGSTVLIADADFANDALWTTAPDAPERADRWTSDAPAVIAALLTARARLPGTSRNWLIRADGLSTALRWPLALLLLLAGLTGALAGRMRTKREKRVVSQE